MHRTGITCIIPIKTADPAGDTDLTEYVRSLCAWDDDDMPIEVIVVDDSSAPAFAVHASAFRDVVQHIRPDPDLATPMGKVGSVLTGVRHASHERVIIADDDVRYTFDSLRRVHDALDTYDVVRPQNYFSPLPWHARWDTGRTLLNRISGGDWPGTLGVRRSRLRATNGYDGSVMFENLELVRTVVAAGGTEAALLDVFVLRQPSTSQHFWSQRVRQAYDELARPMRLILQLAMLPVLILLAARFGWVGPAVAMLCVVAAAEIGRRRADGTRVFPVSCSFFAPAWVLERAVCSWIAVASHFVHGGIRYRGIVLGRAATPMRILRRRHATPNQEALHRSV